MSALNDERRLQLKTDGFCAIPNVLTEKETQAVRTALVGAADAMRRYGISTHTQSLDPNAQNVRVYNLPEVSPLFLELLRHPLALGLAKEILGPHVLVSNFTANIALPGSKSMRVHSDQALVIPPPWSQPWAMNVIWCLDDVHEHNGATRYLAGSYRYTTFEEVPSDAERRTVPSLRRRLDRDGRAAGAHLWSQCLPGRGARNDVCLLHDGLHSTADELGSDPLRYHPAATRQFDATATGDRFRGQYLHRRAVDPAAQRDSGLRRAHYRPFGLELP
jgi:hypothetical protein